MSFHLHTSNRLDRLADQLAEVLLEPGGSPFVPETIVVQSLGMARWLKLELAVRLGVCAHVEFPFPRAFVDRFLHPGSLKPEATSGYDRSAMHWRLFRLLGELPAEPRFDPVHGYLHGGDRRKRLQLAGRLANLFDQYLVFRPDRIVAWDAGEADSKAGWQADLWRLLAGEIGGIHPARLHQELPAALPDPSHAVLAPRIALFGISALPPLYLDVLSRLAETREVHCFLLQPCSAWWGDVTTGRERERLIRQSGLSPGDGPELHLESNHRLLESLGPLGRDFLRLIYEQTDPVEHAVFETPEGDSLLTGLQRDLLDLTGSESTASVKTARADDSLRIHSCHSPTREVEVLHDHLLDWFQRDPTLTPRDVLVMTPDLETYAPRIQAVFDAPEVESQRIPYSLADRGPRQSGRITGTFLNLLQLAHGRATVTELLDLLECEAVRRRVGLVEADLGWIRHWVTETRIHWGRDAAHRTALGLPASEANTWRAGLRRLMLGQAMGEPAGTDAGLFAGILPFADIEGTATEILGHFSRWLESIFSALETLETSRPPAAWIPELRTLLDTLFEPADDEESEIAAIRSALQRLQPAIAAAGIQEAVELPVMLEPISAALEEDVRGGGFLTGGVTFCALKPMRSIPFRIICLLGMNEAAFPRQAPHSTLDLMAAAPRLGDRSTRDDDRYLFLETLISARERLHISYVGQSERDNRPIPPSVVVSELLDFLGDASGKPVTEAAGTRPSLTVLHRLHAFSPAYFESTDADARLFSYSQENAVASVSAVGQRVPMGPFLAVPLAELPIDRREVTLRQLADFFSHPARFFLRERFQLDVARGTTLLEDQEPLLLDRRDGFDVRTDRVAWSVAGGDPAAFVARLAAEGRIPPGESGQLELQEQLQAAEEFLTRLGRPQPGEPVPVDLNLTPYRLRGTLHPQRDGALLHYRCARMRASDALRLWIEHLAAQATAGDAAIPESRLLTDNVTLHFGVVTDPRGVLRTLLEVYWNGLNRPLPFFPKTSLSLVEAEAKASSRSRKTPLDHARDTWLGSETPPIAGECEDLAYRLGFRGVVDPLDAEFENLSREVLGPMLAHWRKVEV